MRHRVTPPRNPENKSILKAAIKVNSKEVPEPEKTPGKEQKTSPKSTVYTETVGSRRGRPSRDSLAGTGGETQTGGLVSLGSWEEPHCTTSLPEALGKPSDP